MANEETPKSSSLQVINTIVLSLVIVGQIYYAMNNHPEQQNFEEIVQLNHKVEPDRQINYFTTEAPSQASLEQSSKPYSDNIQVPKPIGLICPTLEALTTIPKTKNCTSPKYKAIYNSTLYPMYQPHNPGPSTQTNGFRHILLLAIALQKSISISSFTTHKSDYLTKTSKIPFGLRIDIDKVCEYVSLKDESFLSEPYGEPPLPHAKFLSNIVNIYQTGASIDKVVQKVFPPHQIFQLSFINLQTSSSKYLKKRLKTPQISKFSSFFVFLDQNTS